MQPNSPTDSAIARVTVGMTVVDATGAEVGSVSAVQLPGSGVRPDTVAGVAEHLVTTGYLRIDGTGRLSNDVYAGGDQIAEGEPEVVTLRVPREELHRAAS
ncbi:hypothetical protein ACQPZJ_06460 [Actinoplanes sp. CA-054009]